LRAAIYNVDASNNPTTQIGFADITISDTLYNYRQINFATSINVSNNYAVVIQPMSAGGIVEFYVNNAVANQPIDEGLSRIKSAYYVPSSGNWVSVPVLTAAFTGGPYDFEALVAPKVNYTINTNFTATPNPACLGTPVNFVNTTTPTSVLSSRFYNFNSMLTHFQGAPDSTYVWDVDGVSPLIWTQNASFTYPAATTYNPSLYTLGGLWSNCLDTKSIAVTMSPLPTISATAVNPTFCSGNTTDINATGGVSYTWSPVTGLSSTTGAMVTASPTSTTTYTVTGLDAVGCSNTSQVIINVTPLDNATFTYPNNTICEGSSNVIPSITSNGSFGASPSGLVFADASTGELDITSSITNSYLVTFTTNGTCPNTSSQTINITSSPDASFSYSNTNYCTTGSNPTPSFVSGASAGTFSSTTGLVINSATGVVDLAASSPGTYSVTNTIAASGTCPTISSSSTIIIDVAPTATISGGGSICNDGTSTSTITITLTGNGPWDFVYSDGGSPVTINSHPTNSYTITSSNAGTFTVSSVSDASCSNTGSGSASIIVNQLPAVSLSSLSPVCANGSPVALTGGLPLGGTYSGNGVVSSNFDPTLAISGSVITYTYVDGNNCSNNASQSIAVNVAPTVSLNLTNNVVCVTSSSVTIGGGAPSGGFYSGVNVTGTTFNPSTAGLGLHVITYNFTDVNSCSGSASQNITVDACLGVDENSFIENLVIYPNPTNGILNVSFNTTNATNVIINFLSAEGKLVANEIGSSNYTKSLDISSFAKGFYFIQIVTEMGTITKKVLIQ
jgi:hypothetical protein